MAKIIWSPKAINELGRICDYIGENSEGFIFLFQNKILKASGDNRALVEMMLENDWRRF